MFKLREVHTGDVGKERLFEVAPYSLRGVEVRRVSGQYHQLDPLRSPIGEPLSYFLPMMDTRSVPYQPNRAGYLPKQLVQKSGHSLSVESLALRSEVESSSLADSSNRRQMIAAPPFPKYRPLTFGRPGSYECRQQVDGGFISKQDSASLPQPLFLSVGHSCSFHAWTLPSSRCTATRTGFCTLQPILCRMSYVGCGSRAGRGIGLQKLAL